LYFLPKIVLVMKPKIMRWMGHVVCMSRGKVYTGFVGKLKIKGPPGR